MNKEPKFFTVRVASKRGAASYRAMQAVATKQAMKLHVNMSLSVHGLIDSDEWSYTYQYSY